ncbi:MAG: hypothetical protein ACYDG2_24055 [Ruminiclostridium sp.]
MENFLVVLIATLFIAISGVSVSENTQVSIFSGSNAKQPLPYQKNQRWSGF